jgi:two-component system LytT family response regulator
MAPQHTDRPQQPIRALIVDDEPLARTGVIRLLEEEPDVAVVGECKNGAEALASIKQDHPDLLFLDIQMPEMDGFQVLEALDPSERPVIIFVTAYDEYAIRAFEIHAVDYLLKPYSPERFQLALERAREQLTRENHQVPLDQMLQYVRKGQQMLEHLIEESGSEQTPRYLERLVVKSSGRIFFLKSDEIDWIEAAADYVRLHAHGKQHLIRGKISDLERRLDPRHFVRIHRSTIVHLDRIKELQPLFHGDFAVILHDNTQLTLSRSYRSKLAHILDRPL